MGWTITGWRSAITVVSAVISVAAVGAQTTESPYTPPTPDAPTVEAARAWIEQERLRWPTSADGERLVNVTNSTTPEVAHRPTGATCRFWYRTGDIQHTFHDGRHFECSTRRDWFNVVTRINYRETPAEVARTPTHYWNYLRAPRADVAEIASATVQRTMDDLPPGISRTQPISESWTAPNGTIFRYATADVIYPAGTPDGTPPEGIRRVSVIAVGADWLVSYSVSAPIVYRANVEAMHADGLRRLLESLGRGPLDR